MIRIRFESRCFGYVKVRVGFGVRVMLRVGVRNIIEHIIINNNET